MNQMLQGKWKYTWPVSNSRKEFDNAFENIIQPIGQDNYEYDYSIAYQDKVTTKFELINVYAPMLHHEEEYEEVSKRISKRIAFLGTLIKVTKLCNHFFLNVQEL